MKAKDPFGPAIAALSRRILALQQLRQALERIATERSAGGIAELITKTAVSMIQETSHRNGKRKAKPCIK